MGIRNNNSIHLFIDPNFDSNRFKFINNRLPCNEIHIISFSKDTINKWKEEIKDFGISFHSVYLEKDQEDFYDVIYDISTIITEKHSYLCLNTKDPIISNIIINLITLEQMKGNKNSSGTLYSVYDTIIRITPIYPYWNDNCRHVFEILSKKEKRISKRELLDEINVFDISFTKDKLDRALKLIERSLSQYEGFIIEKIGKNKNYYSLKLFVELN